MMTSVTVETISRAVGRDVSHLTRRDLARALLSVAAGEATADLPGLRRELMAAGNPLSAPFWDSAESILGSIAGGTATVGDVRNWLIATGSEPVDMAAGYFVWPEEGERGPVAEEMHARLVAHLEELVAAGVIRPDLLLAGDAEALAAYQEIQGEWLLQPLEDGRRPIVHLDDEETDEFLAAWDDAEADARLILGELLEPVGTRPLPSHDLQRVSAGLRRGLASGVWPYDLLAAAGGVDPAALPDSDQDLWLTLASGAVVCRGEPPDDDPDSIHEYAAWMALQHADWIAAMVSLARAGPGAPADPDTLARWAATFDFEDDDPAPPDDYDEQWLEFDGDDWLDPEWDDAYTGAIRVGFGVVTPMWRVLGAVDADDRLTELGWWGLPEALLIAWESIGD